jgi:hypothetical protein
MFAWMIWGTSWIACPPFSLDRVESRQLTVDSQTPVVQPEFTVDSDSQLSVVNCPWSIGPIVYCLVLIARHRPVSAASGDEQQPAGNS